MKKNIILLFILSIFVVQAFAQKGAEIVFDNRKFDFGKIVVAKTSELSTDFTFTNTGNVPLIISKISVSCGCVITEYDKRPVLPGKKGKIHVKFNPATKYGDVTVSIYIKSNAKNKLEIVRIYSKVINNKK